MPLFKDGDLEVCATKYDQEPFAWVHLALLVFYTRKLGIFCFTDKSGANPVKEFLRIPFTDIFADFCKTCGFLKLRTTFAYFLCPIFTNFLKDLRPFYRR